MIEILQAFKLWVNHKSIATFTLAKPDPVTNTLRGRPNPNVSIRHRIDAVEFLGVTDCTGVNDSGILVPIFRENMVLGTLSFFGVKAITKWTPAQTVPIHKTSFFKNELQTYYIAFFIHLLYIHRGVIIRARKLKIKRSDYAKRHRQNRHRQNALPLITNKSNYMNKPNEDNRLKGIKNAQDRKDYSIAFFNATNSAIALLTPMIDRGSDLNLLKEDIVELRDWFLEEHGKYRALVTDKIGASYDVKNALEKLEATKTKEELEEVWRSFTQDERLDNELRAKCQELKKKYENL